MPLDGSLRSTASWDSAIEASLVGSNSSTLVAPCRDARFPPPLDDDLAAAGSCDSDRSSVGDAAAAASPDPRRRAAGDRLRRVLRKVERKIRQRRGGPGPDSPGPASPLEISSPTVVDAAAMRARMDALRCVDLASGRGHSAPSTPTAERSSLGLDEAAGRRRRQRSLDSAARLSVYDNVAMSSTAAAADDEAQRQLDVILTALYRDIGMLSTSLAVVSEERNGNTRQCVLLASVSLALKFWLIEISTQLIFVSDRQRTVV